MSKVLFVLGAGASAAAGAPLMKDFFQRAKQIRGSSSVELQEVINTVLGARDMLRALPLFRGASHNNLEEIYAAFEMANQVGSFPGLAPSKIESLQNSIRDFLIHIIQVGMKFHYRDGMGIFPHDSYMDFASLIRSVGVENVSVISFNYDCAIDVALNRYNIPFRYELDSEVEGVGGMRLLKLHGSLNWRRCPNLDCENHQRITARPVAKDVNDMRLKLGAFEHGNSELSFDFATRFHCEVCSRVSDGYNSCVIVPPTFNKGRHYEMLKRTWRAAGEAFSQAEIICICGYSMPDTDLFFRHFMNLNFSDAGSRIKRFMVVDNSAEGSLRDRYLNFAESISEEFELVRAPFAGLTKVFEERALIGRPR